MSANTLIDSAATPPASNGNLTPEALDALVARARDVISGRVRPPALVPPPGSVEYLQKQFAHKEHPPTPRAIREITERWSLEATYKGEIVGCFRLPDGSLSVLAVGEEEIFALIERLPQNDAARVAIHDTLDC